MGIVELGALGEFISSIAVLATLIYLTVASAGKEAGAAPSSQEPSPLVQRCFSIALPAAMAAVMLSFWSTTFIEIELYQDRHLPLTQLRALLTDNPIPVERRIPAYRRDISVIERQRAAWAKKVAELKSRGITFEELKALHPLVDRDGKPLLDGEGFAWRLDFLKRHKLAVFRE